MHKTTDSLRRITALSLFSLHTTASTLGSAFFIWTMQASASLGATMPQTLQNLPESANPALSRSEKRSQLPAVIPAEQVPSVIPVPPPVGYPTQQPVERTPSEQFIRYRLGVGDSISVFVERFPELNFQGQVNLEGNIVSPLLGELPMVGLTLQEAQERIRFGLNRFVIDPKVTVTLAGARPAQVTIIGEVLRPGFYPLATGTQLSSAILQTAGGTTSIADLRGIIVRRSLVDGSVIEQRVDLFTPLQNGQPLPDLRLQDGDSVIIPKLEIGTEQDYDRVLVARSNLAQPQITIRVLSYAGRGIGNINLPNGSNFVDALTALNPDLVNANVRSIALIRFDPERGKAVTQRINGKKALQGDISQNVPLQNNDVIVIGRSLVARVTNTLNTFTQPFRDILGFLLFFSEIRDNARDLFGPGNNDDDDD